MYLLPFDRHLPGGFIDAQTVSHLVGRICRRGLGGRVGERAVAFGTSEQGAGARHELAHRERLGQVVVGAHSQSDDEVGLAGAGGEHQYRGRRMCLDAPADLEAVHPRKHQIEDHRIRIGAAMSVDRSRPRVGRDHREALRAKAVRDRLTDQWLVVDDQHRWRLRVWGHDCDGSAPMSAPCADVVKSLRRFCAENARS